MVMLGFFAGGGDTADASAERFWECSGCVRVRERGPVELGKGKRLLRVLVKPLDGREIAPHLAPVARDRPGAR
jgi:hypothetical protein